VVAPSEPADVKGLIKAAIRDDNPVIFFQHKRLFSQNGPVPEEEYLIPLGKGDIKRPGTDITLITYSRMTYLSLEAADQLAREGIDVEVIDLRAEIAARIGEELFDYLDAPVMRLGAKDTPVPFSPVLENFMLPQKDDIIEGVKRVLNR